MALRTGISIIAGSTAFIALGFVLSRWRARAIGDAKGRGGEASINGTGSATHDRGPSRAASLPAVQVVPAVNIVDAQLAVDGGVSARPTEQWRDSVDTYDAANPDDLGAEFLSRAIQVPREFDDMESDLDANGLHVDVLSDDEQFPDGVSGSWALRDEDIAELSTSAPDNAAPDEEMRLEDGSSPDGQNPDEADETMDEADETMDEADETMDEADETMDEADETMDEAEADEASELSAESEQWYAGLREPSWRASRRG